MLVSEVSRSNLATVKAIFEECINDLQEELVKDDFNRSYAELLHDNLKAALKDLKSYFIAYIASISSEERNKVLQEQRNCQISFNKANETYFLKTRHDKTFRKSGDIPESKDEKKNENPSSLPTFDGKSTGFSSWIKDFDHVAEKEGWDTLMKLKHLRSALKGIALATISSVSDTHDGYDKAIQLLEMAFGNDRALLSLSEKTNPLVDEEIANVGLRTTWYTEEEIDKLMKRLKFGDIVQFANRITSHWTIYVGDKLGRGEHMVIFINGDRFFSLFSSGDNNQAIFVPLKKAAESRRLRINNAHDFQMPPSSFKVVLRKIENELESLDRAYNIFSYRDDHFAKFIRNNEETEGFVKKAFKFAVDFPLAIGCFAKVIKCIGWGFSSMKKLVWRR